MKYITYDGVLRHADTFFIRPTNRAFRYGDGLFETIHYHKGKLLFWSAHYGRMTQGMAALRLFRGGFPSNRELKEQVLDLLVKNRVFNDARIRVSVFRRGEGLYTPQNMSASWLVEVAPLEIKGYQWLKDGLHMDFYTDFPRQLTPVSPYKTLSVQANILAGIFAREKNIDDAFIVNDKGKFIESVSSNIFWVKNKIVFTPTISSGCVDGIMRKKIIRLAKAEKIPVIENQGATREDLLNADELFITNVITGIRWVAGVKHKRFYSQMSKTLYKLLNQYVSKIN